MKKVYISGYIHEKNKLALLKGFALNGIETTEDISETDYIYSPSNFINTDDYPNKMFVFGPHFDVFPNWKSNRISNINNNAVYIQPSQWVVDLWKNEFGFNNIPIKSYPFGVDTKMFKSSSVEKDTVIIYYKQRKRSEFNFVLNKVKEKENNVIVFDYDKKYNENNYIETLHRSKYCIWVGRHESQGFALEECLSSGVPILVWDVTKMSQEVGNEVTYGEVKTPCTSAPYFDDTCGFKFHNEDEFDETYERFLKNLLDFKPRDFILKNLTIEKQIEEFFKLFNKK